VNVPMLDVGYGVTDRISASASVPFYRTSYDGSVLRGLDDMYLAGKLTLVDPALTVSEFGVAVSPIVEVLSPGSAGGRVHYALPVSVELRRQPFRVFGSAGYFSRGSMFAGAALEWSAPSGYVVTGALTHPLGQVAAAYVSVGRSLTSIDEGGTAFSLAGGVSFRFTTPRATP
jgi:hypothetical protein